MLLNIESNWAEPNRKTHQSYKQEKPPETTKADKNVKHHETQTDVSTKNILNV